MSGPPGSGKSTLARLLAKEIDAVVVDHDYLRSFFLTENLPWTQSARLAYGMQWTFAESQLKDGRSVIIDSTCNYPETRDQGIELAQRYKCIYKYIECKITDIHTLGERLRNRTGMRSQRTGIENAPPDAPQSSRKSEREIFQAWMEKACRPGNNAIIIDSTRSSDECLRAALDGIGSDLGWGSLK